MLKKGNYFAVDDDDAVRTSVSQNRVTATMWTEEFFLKTQYYIVLPSYKPGKSVGGGTDGQHDTWKRTSWVHNSQLTLYAIKQGLHTMYKNCTQ
jgi:hypothetical protein